MRRYAGLTAAALVAFSAPARGESSGVHDTLHGTRSAAMGGAHRAVGTSNDTLYMNPAGMSIRRRYAIEAQYGYSPFDRLSRVNVSAVDSKTGPVAGAVGYTYTRGDQDGVDARLHRIFLGTGYALTSNVAFGLTTKHIRGTYNQEGETKELSAYTGDLGLMLNFGGLGIGVSYNNVIRTQAEHLAPPTVGTGLSFGGSGFTLAADANLNLSDMDNIDVSYHAGAEYLAGGAFPLRLGYERSSFPRADGSRAPENLITAGVAWVTRTGGVDLAYRHSVNRPENWQLVGALKLFL